MKKITVKDIARASGYSVSTVSKALNNTDRVGAEATEKIKRIAKALGYQSSLSAQSLAGKQRKVAIVLRQSPAEVYNLFQQGLNGAFDIYKEFGIEPVYYTLDALQTPADWRAATAETAGVIAVPRDFREEIVSVLNEIAGKQPLVLLQGKMMTADPIRRLCDVTVNARIVGEMAAQYMSVCVPGRQTAMILGEPSAWIHQENEAGYRAGAARYGLATVAAEACYDDMDRAYAVAGSLLRRYPDLAGIFVTSYVAPAVCRCVQESGRRVTVVGVDLFPETVDCLRSGTLAAAIFQDQRQQGRCALEAVVASFRRQSVPREIIVKPELVLQSNLPCYGFSAEAVTHGAAK